MNNVQYIYGKLNFELIGITIEGTALKTTYNVNDEFNPNGLSVYANYNNGSKRLLLNDDCEWLDGISLTKQLSIGTTSVLCRYLCFDAEYSPIVVTEVDEL